MTKQGYIMLHRTIQNHWIYDEKRKFSKYEAWLDLLMMVNYKDGKILQDGELVEVRRGERITSIRQLMDRWDWSNTKVMKYLELLQSDDMIQFEVTPKKKTLIRIIKYEQYQGFAENDQSEKKTPRSQSYQGIGDSDQSEKKTPRNLDENKSGQKTITENTPKNQLYQGFEGVEDFKKRHRNDTETTQNNINNKENKDNKLKDLKPSCQKFSTTDMENAKLLYGLMLENNPKAKEPNFEKWADVFRLIRERDEQPDKTIKYLIKWSQHDSFWKANILSPTKLRAKWDQLYLKAKMEYEKQQQPITTNKPKIDFNALRGVYKNEQGTNSKFDAASNVVLPKLEVR